MAYKSWDNPPSSFSLVQSLVTTWAPPSSRSNSTVYAFKDPDKLTRRGGPDNPKKLFRGNPVQKEHATLVKYSRWWLERVNQSGPHKKKVTTDSYVLTDPLEI